MEDGFSSYSSLYDTSSLLQFCNDDSASAASGMEVTDRLASLEQRVQMQEDEIQLLKSALADVVRRLNTSEEQQNLQTRRGPTKARPMIAALPQRPTVNNGTVLPKKGGVMLPSPSGGRKDSGPLSNKSTVRRANSNEHVGTGTRKDNGDGKNNRTRAGSTGSNSSGKRTSESKQKDPVFSTGMRRVTHCKVTVQIYLSRSSKRAGPTDTPKPYTVAISGRPAHPTTSASKAAPLPERDGVKASVRKPPMLTLPLKKSASQSLYSPLDTPSYRSPIKSPSQYFQICY